MVRLTGCLLPAKNFLWKSIADLFAWARRTYSNPRRRAFAYNAKSPVPVVRRICAVWYSRSETIFMAAMKTRCGICESVWRIQIQMRRCLCFSNYKLSIGRTYKNQFQRSDMCAYSRMVLWVKINKSPCGRECLCPLWVVRNVVWAWYDTCTREIPDSGSG